nr:hypothetical protein [Tanacetum cinerariifolium]
SNVNAARLELKLFRDAAAAAHMKSRNVQVVSTVRHCKLMLLDISNVNAARLELKLFRDAAAAAHMKSRNA